MTKINYTKIIKENPEDVIHKDKHNYYVIRNFETVEKKSAGGLFGNKIGSGNGKKRKVYIVLRKVDDKTFEEIFKDTSYDRTKSMYTKLRTLNGDKFVVKFMDGKYIFKDLGTGYEFGEYTKASELRKVIKDKYENIYKFKNCADILDRIVKHDNAMKNLKKNVCDKKSSDVYSGVKIKGVKIKMK